MHKNIVSSFPTDLSKKFDFSTTSNLILELDVLFSNFNNFWEQNLGTLSEMILCHLSIELFACYIKPTLYENDRCIKELIDLLLIT